MPEKERLKDFLVKRPTLRAKVLVYLWYVAVVMYAVGLAMIAYLVFRR